MGNRVDFPVRMRRVLVAIAVLVRAPLWLWYAPVIGPDSETYLSMVEVLGSWDLSKYVGMRPPVYPLLLLLLGQSPGLVWAVQSVLGILTVLLTFELALCSGARPIAAFLAGLAVTLSVNLLLLEAGILTESLSTFAIVAVFLLLAKGIRESHSRALRTFLWCGLVIGLGALTKPFLQLLALLVPVFAAWCLWVSTGSLRRAGVGAAAVAVPALALILGWSVFNKAQLDYFGVTTLAGYNLTQHAGAIMEYAPDEYATLRDIYLKYREPRIARTGTDSMTIWDAYPEMLKATGQSFPVLSKTLEKISSGLLLAHPGAYAKTASEAWMRFWKAPLPPGFLEAEGASGEVLNALSAVWQSERYVLVLLKGIFLVSCIVLAIRMRRTRGREQLPVTILAATVLAASVLQALAEYGENARYSLPFQPLVFVVLAAVVLGRKPAS